MLQRLSKISQKLVKKKKKKKYSFHFTIYYPLYVTCQTQLLLTKHTNKVQTKYSPCINERRYTGTKNKKRKKTDGAFRA